MRAAPLEIAEPAGAVCLDCRKDEAGLVWPAKDYDRFIARPELWKQHGYTPVAPK